MAAGLEIELRNNEHAFNPMSTPQSSDTSAAASPNSTAVVAAGPVAAGATVAAARPEPGSQHPRVSSGTRARTRSECTRYGRTAPLVTFRCRIWRSAEQHSSWSARPGRKQVLSTAAVWPCTSWWVQAGWWVLAPRRAHRQLDACSCTALQQHIDKQCRARPLQPMPHRVEGVQELAGGGAPQPQAAVLAAAGQQVAALAPGQRADAARVACQGGGLLQSPPQPRITQGRRVEAVWAVGGGGGGGAVGPGQRAALPLHHRLQHGGRLTGRAPARCWAATVRAPQLSRRRCMRA